MYYYGGWNVEAAHNAMSMTMVMVTAVVPGFE